TCTLYPYTTLFRSNQARRNTLHLLRRRIGRPRLEHFFSRHLACRRGERVIPGLFVNENLQFKRPRFRFAEQPRRQCIERAFAEPVKEMGAAHPTETTRPAHADDGHSRTCFSPSASGAAWPSTVMNGPPVQRRHMLQWHAETAG